MHGEREGLTRVDYEPHNNYPFVPHLNAITNTFGFYKRYDSNFSFLGIANCTLINVTHN